MCLLLIFYHIVILHAEHLRRVLAQPSGLYVDPGVNLHEVDVFQIGRFPVMTNGIADAHMVTHNVGIGVFIVRQAVDRTEIVGITPSIFPVYPSIPAAGGAGLKPAAYQRIRFRFNPVGIIVILRMETQIVDLAVASYVIRPCHGAVRPGRFVVSYGIILRTATVIAPFEL